VDTLVSPVRFDTKFTDYIARHTFQGSCRVDQRGDTSAGALAILQHLGRSQIDVRKSLTVRPLGALADIGSNLSQLKRLASGLALVATRGFSPKIANVEYAAGAAQPPTLTIPTLSAFRGMNGITKWRPDPVLFRGKLRDGDNGG
jgi:hypothetical protein